MPTCFQVVKQMVMNRPAFYLFLTLLCLFVPAIVENNWAVDVDVSAVQADDVSIFEMKRWSPYAAGFGIGVLSWLVFLLSDNTLGASAHMPRPPG
ncbi:MAG: hypothetical protein WBR24_25250 [Desulfobacterales bacterium]